MSKIGKQLVNMPNGVTFELESGVAVIKGPRGELKKAIAKGVDITLEDGNLSVSVKKTSKQDLSNWGTTRSLIFNMVKGVADGWQRRLELVGTGYRAEVRGDTLVLTVGYSHPVEIKAPDGVSFKVEKNVITVEGIDKAVVGQIAANIRSARPPEPYKGKGIKYSDEIIRRKAGKAAKAAA